jgi:ABC-2 type transport system permease protein
MSMFWEFFTFELRFRAKSVSTYVYFLLWLAFAFLSIASENFGPVSNGNGKVLLNGPYGITFNDQAACLFGLIIIAAIFGTSILRDFQRDTYQILFTKPVSKFAYLGGRWAGSFVVTVLVFSGLIVGTYLGTFAPWADHARIGPNVLRWYIEPFLSIVVVQIFFTGSLFFAVAALTRKIFIVYLQGVMLFMFYLVGLTVFSATRSLEHFWSGILDPVGLLLNNAISRYWSVVEKNTQLFPWDFSGYSPGVFLFNRLLWLGVGVAAIVVTFALFPMSVEALTTRAQGKRAARAAQAEQDEATPQGRRSFVAARLPRVRQLFGWGTTLRQYSALTSLRIRLILREFPFWAIVGLLVVFAINNGHFAGRVGGVDVWPVTYLMAQAVEGSATLFFYIVAALYAAELIWREKDTRFDGIHDALPIGVSVDWLAKLSAVAVIELILLAVAMLACILMQALAGYYHFEIYQYIKEFLFITYPQILGLTMFAMFVHTIVSNKFVGHGIVIAVFVLQTVLLSWGWENTLLIPGGTPSYVYSDMNGYGPYVPSLFWAITYWISAFAVLGIVSMALARRGSEESLRARFRLARGRLPLLSASAAVFALITALAGGWYYYNAHILNEYITADERRHRLADYERQFKQYEKLDQPKITAVDTVIDIYPAQRSFSGTGRFTLQNKSAQPLSQIHITDQNESVSQVQFDRPVHLLSKSAHGMYSIFELDRPLSVGEVVTLTFAVAHASRGFRNSSEAPEFAYNGTFFGQEFFPTIGYDPQIEIDDPRRRREEHLSALEEMPERGDPRSSRINLFTANADWITYHTVVSTSDDQIAIAPGYLARSWQKDGRRYYEYGMGSTHTLDFFAYMSASYETRKQSYAGVNGPISLEVYFDPAHTFNVDQMLAASRAGLEYFEKNFSPFQFNQYRILEFPRYRTFAQSFPNTVPFSESIGFISRVLKPTDVDLTFFVTEHELGHQWWGHQLIGGLVQGSNMMSETLAQYSAYMVMQQKYGKDYMHRVMRHWLDRYLRGRAGEVRGERPLALVQRESYVWYEKGGQIMYTLADYVGEDKINLALHNFLMQYRYANAHNQTDAVQQESGTAAENQPYPDTRQLIAALREQTPPELQYLIDDGFNRIVLYDNKVISATAKKTADGKYLVTLEVEARKSQSDANGVETPMPMADFIDIGVFSGEKDQEKPLYMKREKFTGAHRTFSIVVDERPTRAGIDPYNKLIDRISEDNLADITEL